jgi:peptidoglycan/xylan/chitin deacetylase (PgdA/CDA1 family)
MMRKPAALSILIYHRVLARPDPLFPGDLDAVQFDRQLRLLKRFFTVLPVAEAVRRLRGGSLPPRAACITFDDGYADNAEVALPLLQTHGLSACFFIATGYLDGGMMWNDRVIAAVRAAQDGDMDLSDAGLGVHPLGDMTARRQAIETILRKLKYLPFAQRQAQAGALLQRYSQQPLKAIMMSSGQVQALHRAGMEIGAHTVSHPILTAVAAEEARADIAQGRAELEKLTGAPVKLFAYPNGKPGVDYDASHVQMVRSLGFEAAVATHWGAAQASTDPFQLPRFTPWDRGRLAFLLRMAQNLRRPVPADPL